MRRFFRLWWGEIVRLAKYKVLFFGLLVSAIWVVILVLSDAATAEALIPTLVGMDAGMMSMLLLGSMFYFEKQEGTIHTLLVTPVPLGEILFAKVAASMATGILSMFLVAGSAWIVHGISVNFLLMTVYDAVVVAGNTAIGYLLVLSSKEFMGMLMKMMGVLLLFYVPVILVPLGILGEDALFVALLSPSYAGSFLFESLYSVKETWMVLFCLGYLGGLAGVLYPLVIRRRYARIAVEG